MRAYARFLRVSCFAVALNILAGAAAAQQGEPSSITESGPPGAGGTTQGTAACYPALAPVIDTLGVKNRYLSFAQIDPSRTQAIRITIRDMPPPFESAIGQTMWITQPWVQPGDRGLCPFCPLTAFNMATTTCEPVFVTWDQVVGQCSFYRTCYSSLNFGAECTSSDDCGPAVLHVAGPTIIPGGTYEIQALDITCDPLVEEQYSAALVVQTGRWGDVTSVAGDGYGPPDGDVDIIDAVAVLERFMGTVRAPTVVQTDMEPGTPDGWINITDAVAVLDAFAGETYPFELAPPCP